MVLSEGKFVLVGEFICRFLWSLKFRKIFSSVPSKENKSYVRKKVPVTKLRIVKTSRMFSWLTKFPVLWQLHWNYKKWMVFCWKKCTKSRLLFEKNYYCYFSKKETFDSDYYVKYGKIFRHVTFVLYKNLLKIFDCSKKSRKLSIMKTELNISTATPKNYKIM